MKQIKWAVLIAVLVSLDQLSKWLAESYLPLERPVEIIPFFDLFLTYNYGVAFSWLTFLGPYVLIALTLAIMVFITWLWRNLEAGRRLSELGFAFVIGGALGNLIDRIAEGRVVDMFLFHIEQLNFNFAVFNVADIYITVGAGLIILDEIVEWRKSRNSTGKTNIETNE